MGRKKSCIVVRDYGCKSGKFHNAHSLCIIGMDFTTQMSHSHTTGYMAPPLEEKSLLSLM